MVRVGRSWTFGKEDIVRPSEENDPPKLWINPIVIAATATLVIGGALGFVWLQSSREAAWVSSFTDHTTQKLDLKSARRHWVATYGEHRSWISRRIEEGVRGHPNGSLFHYDSPTEEGYAILHNGRIAWRCAVWKKSPNKTLETNRLPAGS